MGKAARVTQDGLRNHAGSSFMFDITPVTSNLAYLAGLFDGDPQEAA